MTPLTQITSRDWQLALGQPGDVVADLDDIDQCIRVILTTPKGTDPLRPEFACDLWRYIDHPIDVATPHLVREAWDAIETFELRVELIRIVPRLGDAPGQIVLHVIWRLRGESSQNNTEVKV